MDTLNRAQQDVLNEFVVVTGTSLDEEDTMAKAIALLAHYDHNLNNAVLAFFDKGFDLPEPITTQFQDYESQTSFGETSFESRNDRLGSSNYSNLQSDFSLGDILPRLAKAPRISNKWQLDLGIHISRKAFQDTAEKKYDASTEEKPRKLSILWIILLIVPRAFSLLYSAFRYFFGLNLSSAIYDIPSSHFAYDKYDETYDAKSELLSEEIESAYDISHQDFNAKHENSQQDYRFLLVILCNDKSVEFTKSLLESQGLRDLFDKSSGSFKESQLFVNNIEKSPEAFEVAKTYKCRRAPFIFLVGNVTRDPSIMSSMSVIYKANCALGDEEEQGVLMKKVIKNLGRTLNDYNPQLISKRFDKQEVEMSRIIKEKQDEAYLESLHSDKVKKIEKESQRAEAELQDKLKRLRKSVIQRLTETKHFEQILEGVAAGELIRISIKLPDGRRIVQKFPKSASMGEIYLFVETQLEVGESEETEAESDVESAEMAISEFLDQFTFNFELFKPLPKCCLPSSRQSIAKFQNLKSGDNVLFEYVGDDSEDDDN